MSKQQPSKTAPNEMIKRPGQVKGVVIDDPNENAFHLTRQVFIILCVCFVVQEPQFTASESLLS